MLNSLAGEFLFKSMSVVAPFGRFLEIGKRDIYSNSKLGILLSHSCCLSFLSDRLLSVIVVLLIFIYVRYGAVWNERIVFCD